jgi:5-methyltetrahydrofolate--homocysteine methyltransferase
MKKYIANLSACADCFVFCYPNAGLPNAMGGYDQKGPEMAEEIRPFCEENLVNAIGGCCGSTPEHIAAIAGAWAQDLLCVSATWKQKQVGPHRCNQLW